MSKFEVEMNEDQNEILNERYELAFQKIQLIMSECDLPGEEKHYFMKVAGFLNGIFAVYRHISDGAIFNYSEKELMILNRGLYEDIVGASYEKSYANPQYAVEIFGKEKGELLSFLYTEMRGLISSVFEGNKEEIVIYTELFLEVYFLFEKKEDSPETIKKVIYWFEKDNSEIILENRIKCQFDPDKDFAVKIIMEQDLEKKNYLYYYGEYITETERRLVEYLNEYSQTEINAMAHTFVNGYCKGFEAANIDISKKKYVNIRYCVGFERIVKAMIKELDSMGLKPLIYRAASKSLTKKGMLKIGYYASSPNKQYEYDHRYDDAIYLDKGIVERKLEVTKQALESVKKNCAVFAGPAVMEVFGEIPFEPENKKENLMYTKEQEKLKIEYNAAVSKITNEYVNPEERSFSIIAYPTPEIGEDFEAIFKETVKVNNLDSEEYKKIQQAIIDVLDEGDYVNITGQNGNVTDIKVKLFELNDKKKETIFENCVADVNIPVGEVFTSPVLEGTKGILNVSKVYLDGLEYKNLTLKFENGMVVEYDCDNFKTKEENQNYIHQNLLQNRNTLPLGEFAIGTNTTAYKMAEEFDILNKLPILIVEKTGPHFALGDTCYSHSENVRLYNPDGKEIVAKDNSCSRLREENPEKAYFNCHTDITIPFHEIGEITVVSKDGNETKIIENGKFVLAGTEKLNEPLEDMK